MQVIRPAVLLSRDNCAGQQAAAIEQHRHVSMMCTCPGDKSAAASPAALQASAWPPQPPKECTPQR